METMRITKNTLMEAMPEKSYGRYSNGIKFNETYRSTIKSIINRGYYDGVNDKVKFATIAI